MFESFDMEDTAYSDLKVNIAILNLDSYPSPASSYNLEKLIGKILTKNQTKTSHFGVRNIMGIDL